MNTLWTLTSLSFGLVLAATVSYGRNEMSFFTAVQVQNLLW